MTNRLSRITICAIMIICLIGSFALPVRAAECTLTLVCQNEGEPIADLEWSVFRVGEKSSDGGYVLTGDFSEYAVSLDNLETASDMQDAANTLKTYALLDSIVPFGSGTTDENGRLSIDGVESGLYLVVGKTYFTDTQMITPAPLLVEFTADQISEGDIAVYPKITFELIPDDTEVEFGVRKVWDILEGFEDAQPDDVVIGIYMDGELYQEVTLNDSNNWEYFWTDDYCHDWAVKELSISDNFTVVYRENETLFQVENSYVITGTDEGDSSSESESESSSNSQSDSQSSSSDTTSVSENSSSVTSQTASASEKLPQTGSLWWPVPILAASGVIMVAVGMRLNNKRK